MDLSDVTVSIDADLQDDVAVIEEMIDKFHNCLLYTSELCNFADKLEQACIKTIEDGKMTKSLSLISTCEHPVILNSLDFIKAIRETLDSLL